LARAVKQRCIGNIHKPNRSGPGRCAAQAAAAKAISQNRAQHADGVCECPRPQKGTAFPRTRFQRRRAAKAFDASLPVFIQKRSVGHAMPESDSIRLGKNFILAPMRQSRTASGLR
jgi:hypothetical protein